MAVDMSQFYEVFFDEAEELLAEAEHLLLNVSIENPDNEELNAIFRAAHSIKGGAATFGFSDMTEITHVLENLLDKIRKHELALTSEHVDAFLAAKDVLEMEVAGHRNGAEVNQEQVSNVKMMLQSLSDASNQAQTSPAEESIVETSATPPVTESAPASPVVVSDAPKDKTVEVSTAGFKIVLPDTPEKDVENLASELALLGEVSRQALENNQVVLHLLGDSTKDDIVSICSFVLDPDLLIITPLSANAVTNAVASAQVTSTTAEIKPTDKSKVDIEEEVGYGLFADDGQAEVEEGYGFLHPLSHILMHPKSR